MLFTCSSDAINYFSRALTSGERFGASPHRLSGKGLERREREGEGVKRDR